MGFLRWVLTGNSGNEPLLIRKDLTDCILYLINSHQGKERFGIILNKIYIYTKDGPFPIQTWRDRANFFGSLKWEVIRSKDLQSSSDPDFCEYYMLQTYFEGIAKRQNKDKGIRDGATIEMGWVIEACVNEGPPDLVKIWLEYVEESNRAPRPSDENLISGLVLQ